MKRGGERRGVPIGEQPDPDVIVIGAGPAGSVASAVLAKKGRRVLLVDRAKFPRKKICGDAIAYSCMQPLVSLGLAEKIEKSSCFATGVMRVHTSSGRELRSAIRSDKKFVQMIPRPRLDSILLDSARDLGVQVVENCQVERVSHASPELTTVWMGGEIEGPVSAPIVMVAGGAGCGRLLGGLGFSGVEGPMGHAVRGYFEDVGSLEDAVEFVTHDRVLPGYFWIFPMNPRLANVGVVSYRGGLDLKRELAWFLTEHPRGRALGVKGGIGSVGGGVIPVLSRGGTRVGDGFLVCGDAGWFCDPLTFHGIGPAIWSGQLAADAADVAFQRGRFDRSVLGEYDVSWRRQFGVNALLLGMNLFDGEGFGEGFGQGSRGVGLSQDAGARYESLLRMFAQ